MYDHSHHDLAWDSTGTRYVVSSKDQRVHFIDARSSSVSAVIEHAHEGVKSVKLASLCDAAERVLTVSNGRGSLRQCKIWDPRRLQSEVHRVDVDHDSGVLMPFYDPHTGLLFLAGKGEAGIKYFEIPFNGSEIHTLSEYRSNVATRGMAMVSKRNLDVSQCEINRFLKLTSNSVEPVSFFVPRKSTSFQDDLYPNIYGDIAPHTMDEWMTGSNKMPKKISLFQADAFDRLSFISNSSEPATPTKLSPQKSVKFQSSNKNVIGESLVGEWIKAKEEQKAKNKRIDNISKTPIEDDLMEQITKAKKRILNLEQKLRKAGLRAD
jgi:WD40 repeat protein